MLNDVAVAIRALEHAGAVARSLVIDLDVHQGNGTAAIFAGDPDVYTFSIHGERNYPTVKMTSPTYTSTLRVTARLPPMAIGPFFVTETGTPI